MSSLKVLWLDDSVPCPYRLADTVSNGIREFLCPVCSDEIVAREQSLFWPVSSIWISHVQVLAVVHLRVPASGLPNVTVQPCMNSFARSPARKTKFHPGKCGPILLHMVTDLEP